MQSLKAHAHIGGDGFLKLEMPVDVVNADVELVIVMQPVASPSSTNSSSEKVEKFDREAAAAIIAEYGDIARQNGWPDGFFEQTFGAFADDPIERPEQPPLEVRDEIL